MRTKGHKLFHLWIFYLGKRSNRSISNAQFE
jgi:hypothetical protein